jgi:CRISPR type III-B/RAMP module RAMP protein Cmr6
MTRLPDELGDALASGNAALFGRIENVGLAYHKLAPVKSPDKPEQGNFVRNLAEHGRVPASYADGFARWCRRTPRGPQRRVLTAGEVGRVLCGLGGASPTENGLSLHPLYGTPVLPGSSLKGIARAWATRAMPDAVDPIAQLFGTIADHSDDEVGGVAGLVGFLDAWWIPEGVVSPWVAEVLTPHARQYYERGAAPAGMENPNPVTYLAARGSFRVVLEGPEGWVDRAAELLQHALRDLGVGAKTRSGFGRFTLSDDLCRIEKVIEQQRADRIKRAKDEEERRVYHAAFAAAETPVGKLDIWAARQPADSLVASLRRWLKTDGGTDDALLGTLDPDAAGVLERAVELLFGRGEHGGLLKTLSEGRRDRASEEIRRLSGAVAPTKDFGPNAWDASGFWDARRLGKPGALNKFAQHIVDGAFDEPTVRAAVEHLRANGARPGHLRVIFERYPAVEPGEAT